MSIASNAVSPSAGCAVNVSGPSQTISQELSLTGTYNGACVNNAGTVRFAYVDVSQIGNDSFYINGSPNVFLDHTTTFQNAGSPGNASYHFVNIQGFHLSNCTGQSQNYAILVNPTTGNSVFDGFIQNCDLDNSQLAGVLVDTSGGGTAYALQFTGSRTGFSGGPGVQITGPGNSIWNLNFVNHQSVKNVKWGFNINAGNGVSIQSSEILGNAASGGTYDGISVSSADHVLIEGNFIGQFNNIGNNQRFGVALQAGFTGHAIIRGNDLSGNANGGLINSSSSVLTTISGNQGTFTGTQLCNGGSAVIASGSNSVTLSHGLTAAPTYLNVSGSSAAYTYGITATSTQITITSSANVASDTTVYWQGNLGLQACG